MAKMTQGRLDRLIPAGALLRIPGLSQARGLDHMPFVISSGKLDLVNAVAEQGAILIPFRAKLLAVRSRVRTACGTAAGTAALGKQGAATYFGTQAHETTDSAGTIKDWTLDQTLVAENDVLMWSGDGGASSTGDCDCVAILVPWDEDT